MSQRLRASREVTLPAGSLTALRRSLREEAGPLVTTHGLHAAGFGAGEALYQAFAAGLERHPAELGERVFWNELGTFFARRGWGSLSWAPLHSGFGLLRTGDWAEADPDGGDAQPSCAFSAGLFATLLGRVAGRPVAVLEVACRSRGDDECQFVFGSEVAIHLLYGRLLDDPDVGRALDQL